MKRKNWSQKTDEKLAEAFELVVKIEKLETKLRNILNKKKVVTYQDGSVGMAVPSEAFEENTI